jgi:hypothetical protein
MEGSVRGKSTAGVYFVVICSLPLFFTILSSSSSFSSGNVAAGNTYGFQHVTWLLSLLCRDKKCKQCNSTVERPSKSQQQSALVPWDGLQQHPEKNNKQAVANVIKGLQKLSQSGPVGCPMIFSNNCHHGQQQYDLVNACT